MFDKFAVVNDKGSILAGKFSDFLLDEFNIIKINGQLAMYSDGVYVSDSLAIERAMLDFFPEISQSKRREVLAQLVLKARPYNDLARFSHLIAFRNGVYDIYARQLIPFDKSYILTNRIPWDFNPAAYSRDVDKFLASVSCYDEEIRALLEEVVGYSMYRSLERGLAFILVGSASNGKSTYQSLLIHLLGRENVSSVSLASLTSNRFSSARLFGKLANISDDISSAYIEDPAQFKSLATGEHIMAEEKYGTPFEFDPYATMIFSANRIPRIKSDGGPDGGVKRRMCIVPFLRVFKEGDPDFDVGIRQRIIFGSDDCSGDDSMSYMVNLGLAGLSRVLARGFTQSAKCAAALAEYDRECNPILEWCDEYLTRIDSDSFASCVCADAYDAYHDWCLKSGMKPSSAIAFNRFIREKYGLEVRPAYHPIQGTVRTFVLKQS